MAIDIVRVYIDKYSCPGGLYLAASTEPGKAVSAHSGHNPLALGSECVKNSQC